MRLPRLFRTTPFRLTLLFLALFGAAASAFLAYIYVATAGEAQRRTDQDITREAASLAAAYNRGGLNGLNQSLIERAANEQDEAISAAPSSAVKCERCWHYRDDVGSHADHPGICGRCVGNLAGAGEVRRHA